MTVGFFAAAVPIASIDARMLDAASAGRVNISVDLAKVGSCKG